MTLAGKVALNPNTTNQPTNLTLYKTIQSFDSPKEEGFWKHFEKRRKYWLPLQHFLLFLPIMFSVLLWIRTINWVIFELLLANVNLDKSILLLLHKELRVTEANNSHQNIDFNHKMINDDGFKKVTVANLKINMTFPVTQQDP